jgi:Tfp pilus assembly protein PilE
MKRRLKALSRSLAVITIVASVLGLLLLQAIAINRANDLAEQIARISNERTKQIDAVQRNIECVTKFFAQKGRTNKSIEEINECRIITEQGEDYTFTVPAATGQETMSDQVTVNPQPTVSPAPAAQTPVAQTPSQPAPPEPRPLLGIPLVDSVIKLLGGN